MKKNRKIPKSTEKNIGNLSSYRSPKTKKTPKFDIDLSGSPTPEKHKVNKFISSSSDEFESINPKDNNEGMMDLEIGVHQVIATKGDNDKTDKTPSNKSAEGSKNTQPYIKSKSTMNVIIEESEESESDHDQEMTATPGAEQKTNAQHYDDNHHNNNNNTEDTMETTPSPSIASSTTTINKIKQEKNASKNNELSLIQENVQLPDENRNNTRPSDVLQDEALINDDLNVVGQSVLGDAVTRGELRRAGYSSLVSSIYCVRMNMQKCHEI